MGVDGGWVNVRPYRITNLNCKTINLLPQFQSAVVAFFSRPPTHHHHSFTVTCIMNDGRCKGLAGMRLAGAGRPEESDGDG